MTSKFRFGLLLVSVSLLMAGSFGARPLTSRQILDLLNQDREKHGLADLTMNSALNLAALAKAEDMKARGYFAHISPDGNLPWYWFQAMGYNYAYAGENLAEGYTNAFDLENSWMSSPAHRANILSPFYSEVGLAVVVRANTSIIVQFFGSKSNIVSLRQ